MRRLLIVLLLLTAGCGFRSAERLYGDISKLHRTGRLQVALERLDGEGKPFLDGRDAAWQAPFHILRAEVLLAQGKLAEAQKDLSQPAREPRWEARRQFVLGGVLLRQKRYSDAKAALSVARRDGDPSTQVMALVYSGALLAYQADYAGAEGILQQALAEATRNKDQYARSGAFNNLAFVRNRQFRYDDAIAYATSGVQAAASIDALWLQGRTAINVADNYTQLGDFEQARQWQERSYQLFNSVGDRIGVKDHFGVLGNLLLYQGKPDEAAKAYRRAYDMAVELKLDASPWADNAAIAYIDAGRWDDAERWTEEAFKLKTAARQTESLAFARLNRAAIAQGRGRLDDAEREYGAVLETAGRNVAVKWEAESGLAAVELARNRFLPARGHFDAALALIESALGELKATESKITFPARLIRFYQQYVDALMERGDSEAALRIAESSRARILAVRADRGVADPVPAGIVAEVRTLAARQRSAVLFYWLAPRRSYVWLIDGAGVKAVELPPAPQIAQAVTAYRGAIERGAGDPLRAPSGAALSHMLLGPLAQRLKSAARVAVVADGALHHLNLECLPVGDTPHYFLEDATLSIAPSLTMLVDRPPAPQPSSSLLLVGAAEAAGGEYRKLDRARSEIDSIRADLARLPSTVLAGADARATRFQQAAPEHFSLIHFAAHAESGRRSPLDSAIILTPEGDQFRLYIREILKMPRLNADLVTVSACRSAGETSFAGEGLIGFAWAFLEAGARSVVAGLWDVSDSSSERLMVDLYRGIAGGAAPAEALRHAKLEMLHAGRWSAPYYWGPFQVYERSTLRNNSNSFIRR